LVYDVAVIGAGVVGAFIARELSRYELKICLLEKEWDVGEGASSANSGIIHAGYDAVPGTFKAGLNVRGNKVMDKVARELDIPFKRTGSLVLAFDEWDMAKLGELYKRGAINGVPGIRILTGEQVRDMEPNVASNVTGGLYAPTAGVICPYELVLGAAENAVSNGVELKSGCEVIGIGVESVRPKLRETGHNIFTVETGGGEITARYVVNAAGVYADKISAMAGDESFTIIPRKGEYLLLDKDQGDVVGRVIFQTPSRMGKGILVVPTVDGNLLVGPNAQDIEDKEDRSTSIQGLEEVKTGALRSVPAIDMRKVVTSFAGLRAVPSTGDFFIGESGKVKGFINAAGIESPGLTSAPAIAEYVVEILRLGGLDMKDKTGFNPVRKPRVRFHLSSLGGKKGTNGGRQIAQSSCCMVEGQISEIIKGNPMYGRVVCRCEKVTEGEIVDSIKRPAGARTLDGVKRRTRAGMGRCQGGFCTPRVMEILSRELGIPMDRITKSGKGSELLKGKTK